MEFKFLYMILYYGLVLLIALVISLFLKSYLVIILLSLFFGREIFKIVKYMIKNDYKKIEKDVFEEGSFSFDNCYGTKEYLFDLRSLKKIYYKDIYCLEGGPCLLGGRINGLGFKYKVFFNGGHIVCKFGLTSDKADKFVEYIKGKNPEVFVGIIEEYRKLGKKNEKDI